MPRFVLILLLLVCAFNCKAATGAEVNHIREIATNVVEVSEPYYFPRLAFELGKYPCMESLNALSLMWGKCQVEPNPYTSSTTRDDLYIARAYILYSVARIGSTFPPGAQMLKEHSEISRPLGMAFLQAKSNALISFLKKGVPGLIGSIKPASSDTEVYLMKKFIPGTDFIIKNCPDLNGEGIRFEDLRRMLEAICLLEMSGSKDALPLLNQMLGTNDARYWEKAVFRAVYNLDITDEEKFEFYKRAYAMTKNKTVDKAPKNLKGEPEFSIRNISGEAHLILLVSRLDIPIKEKGQLYEKSLVSKSFTAKEAVVDAMIREGLFKNLMAVFSGRNKDMNLAQFAIYRLGYDASAGSKDILKKLVKGENKTLAETAKEALLIK